MWRLIGVRTSASDVIKGGDVFGFVMEMESLTFPEAMRTLAERAHIEISRRNRFGDRAKENERNTAVLNAAVTFFQVQFHESPEGEVARQALHDRKQTRVTAREFGLGYAPEGGHGLIDAAVREQVTLAALHDAELAVHPEGEAEYRDRWQGCLVYPDPLEGGQRGRIRSPGIERAAGGVGVCRGLQQAPAQSPSHLVRPVSRKVGHS